MTRLSDYIYVVHTHTQSTIDVLQNNEIHFFYHRTIDGTFYLY